MRWWRFSSIAAVSGMPRPRCGLWLPPILPTAPRRWNSSASRPGKDTLGWVLYRRGDYSAAAEYLEAAVEGLPEHPLVRYHLARTYAALERHDDAKAELTRAAALVGQDDPLGEKIYEALREQGTSRTVN